MSGQRAHEDRHDAISERPVARRIRLFVVLIGAIVLVVLVATTVITRPAGGGGRSPAVAWLAAAAGGVVAIVALAVLAPLLLRSRRLEYFRRPFLYSWNRRMRVARAMTKGGPIDAQDLPVARSIIDSQQVPPWALAVYVALVAFLVVDGIDDDSGSRWVKIGLGLLQIPMSGFALWQRRRLLRGYARMAALHPLRVDPDVRETGPNQQG